MEQLRRILNHSTTPSFVNRKSKIEKRRIEGKG
jgi:hypothetical protein